MNVKPSKTRPAEQKIMRGESGQYEPARKNEIIYEILNMRLRNNLTQRQLEKASGVKQPIIAKLENGVTDPQLTTVLRILRPYGKTLKIVPMDECP
jgi:predicted transcriptional regulator